MDPLRFQPKPRPESLVCEEIPVCRAPEPEVSEPPRPCNGFEELCSRPLDRTVFATTHNSYAARREGFISFNANQWSGIEAQLRDGIRALMLDVHRDEGELALCHSFCYLGRTPHRQALRGIRAFLEENPREVLALLYEDHVSPREIESDFLDVGLESYAYIHPPSGAWPTLGEMIEAGTRLLVLGERGAPPPAWYHSLWELASDNPYGQHSTADFGCRPNRGRRSNPLLLMNHWLNNALDLPSEEGAGRANRLEMLYPRTMDCIQETRKVPNFIAVNYYEQGDLLGLVELLNGVQYDPDFLHRALDSLTDMRRPQDFFLFGREVQPWSPFPTPESPADGEILASPDSLAFRP